MKQPPMNIGKEALTRFDEAIQKEWLITNGLGGYASSTVLGVNTRKYHGLLVAALHPPGDRRVCLAKMNEEIVTGNDIHPLGANEFQSGIFPQGHLQLKEFELSPFPKFVYGLRDIEVRKTVFLQPERNTLLLLYRVLNRSNINVNIRLLPLINGRHFHSVLNKWQNPTEFPQKHEGSKVSLQLGAPTYTLTMKATAGRYHTDGKWVEKLYYREEAARGEQCLDDCYQPGRFEVGVKASGSEDFAVTAVASKTEREAEQILEETPTSKYDVDALLERTVQQRERFLARFYEEHKAVVPRDWLSWLVLATDSFIVEGTDDAEKSVIAGYHWFEAWGRDAFVSLPGLMLVTGRAGDARNVFLTFRKHCNDGLIPNFIPDQGGAAVYNSVDATLWFVNAVLQYVKYTGDFRFVGENLWETLKAVMEHHVKGTALGIRVDGDGLLSHGAQLTWMDAAVDGQPVTPRAGKAVEVQALWYNALKTVEFFARSFREQAQAEEFLRRADLAKRSFVEKFWNEAGGCLFDVVGEGGGDASVRPNQVVALALDFSMLDRARGERVVDVVRRELLTLYGLRTLAKGDSRYVGVYAGDRRSRDKAYHNGAAWPWLLGPFVTAFLRTKGYTDFQREYALRKFLVPLFSEQVFNAGLGSLSEVFDGDAPHGARGCIAQAWSVAEPLRAFVEDVMLVRPKHEREVLRPLG